jgi:predicted nuclease of predicted toxin-antitoxin system
MKIDVDECRNIRLREVFDGIILETPDCNRLGVCMRDDTFEINIIPYGSVTGNWWRVNMKTGTIEPLKGV